MRSQFNINHFEVTLDEILRFTESIKNKNVLEIQMFKFRSEAFRTQQLRNKLTKLAVESIERKRINYKASITSLENREIPPQTIDKGFVGKMVETIIFNLPNNSSKNADFPNIPLELKSTQYQIDKKSNLPRQKEDLKLTALFDKQRTDFRDSHLFAKNRQLLIVWLQYGTTSFRHLKVTHYKYLNLDGLSKAVFIVLEEDWNRIQSCIHDGKDFSFTRRQNKYLIPMSSGPGRTPETRRAFAFKKNFINFYLQSENKADVQKISLQKLLVELHSQSTTSTEDIFEATTKKHLEQFKDMSISQIALHKELNILQRKNRSFLLDEIEEFDSLDIKKATITLNSQDRMFESKVKVCQFQFESLVEYDEKGEPVIVPFEKHKLYKILNLTWAILFFQGQTNNWDELVYKDITFWVPSLEFMDAAKTVYNQMAQCVISGKILSHSDSRGRPRSYFPNDSKLELFVSTSGTSKSKPSKLPVACKKSGVKEFKTHAFYIRRSVFDGIYTQL